MKLFEFEGKRVLSDYGVPIPASTLLTNPNQIAPFSFPFVLKAQAMTGGRGKAGGVRICHNQEEYNRFLPEMFSLKIKGLPVYGLMAETFTPAQRELYLSITLQGVDKPTLIAGYTGGIDIEEAASENPERILRIEIDPFIKLKNYQLRSLCRFLGLSYNNETLGIIKNIQQTFFDTGALLVEINPLGIVHGKLIALDAKIELDNNACSKCRDLINRIIEQRKTLYKYHDCHDDGTTITFVPMEGQIALISDGAGTGMLSLDILHDLGGEVASFCELGGITNPDVMYKALEYSMGLSKKPSCVLIVLIGGFNRMDEMAEGIVSYVRKNNFDIPIYTRMVGTMEEKGKIIMADAGLKTYDLLMDAATAAVSIGVEVNNHGNID